MTITIPESFITEETERIPAVMRQFLGFVKDGTICVKDRGSSVMEMTTDHEKAKWICRLLDRRFKYRA